MAYGTDAKSVFECVSIQVPDMQHNSAELKRAQH